VADSRRLRILEALLGRIELIDGTGGELPQLGPDDPDKAIAIIVGEDQVEGMQVGKLWINLPVNFVALANPRIDQPWRIAEQVLADIKTAVERPDLSLGGLLSPGRNNPEGLLRGTTEVNVRQSGSETVGVAITYVAHHAESLGRPEA
jgi:hypothetical protein